MGDNELSVFFEAMERDSLDRRDKLAQFNEQLRDPDDVLIFEEGLLEYGLWRVPQGVWKLRKYKNGYHPNDGQFISTEELLVLRDVFDKPTRDLIEEED